MKENKYTIIISFLLMLCCGLPPIWIPQDWLISAYLLAIFGGCVLSMFICLASYTIYKRENLRAVAMGGFNFLKYQIKYLEYINTRNKGNGGIIITGEEIIEVCKTAKDVLSDELEKIDKCIDGLFILNWKWKSLLKKYRKKIKENIFDGYSDVHILMLRGENEFSEIKQELYKYMFDLAKYDSYEEELTTIRKWVYGKKLYEMKFLLKENSDHIPDNIKQKLKKTYSNK